MTVDFRIKMRYSLSVMNRKKADKMKKITILALSFALLAVCLSGCSGEGGQKVEGTLEELTQRIYGNLDPSVELPPVMNMALTEEGTEFNPHIEYFIGAKGIPFAEGLVSEAAIGAHAYSLVLLRMEPGADIEAAKALIKENVDPMKWICVGVDPADVVVDSIGDLVVLIMSEHSAALREAFQKLAG